jgi:integrase
MATIRKRKWTTDRGEQREAWIVDYVDQTGQRRGKNFSTKKEAEAWRTNAMHEVQQGIHTAASTSKTVEEAWQLWMADCEANNLEFGTIRQRRQHLKHHVMPFIGHLRLADLTTPLVYDFDAKLREGRDKQPPSPRSLALRRKVLTNLKTMVTFAQGRGLVAQNVALGVRIKVDTSGPLRSGVDFPTMAELNALIENSTGRWRPFIVTAIFTGMRLSELRGLRWSDVDLDAGQIHVRQRADQWLKIGPTKSKAGMRDIPLAPMVVNTLKQWQTECPKGALDLVFPNTIGNIETMRNIHSRCWMPLQAKCGLPGYGFHMLRHAAASLFIKYLGWSPKRLQTVMGHASINMTFDRYGHLFEDVEADRNAMAKIEAAIRAA